MWNEIETSPIYNYQISNSQNLLYTHIISEVRIIRNHNVTYIFYNPRRKNDKSLYSHKSLCFPKQRQCAKLRITPKVLIGSFWTFTKKKLCFLGVAHCSKCVFWKNLSSNINWVRAAYGRLISHNWSRSVKKHNSAKIRG